MDYNLHRLAAREYEQKIASLVPTPQNGYALKAARPNWIARGIRFLKGIRNTLSGRSAQRQHAEKLPVETPLTE